MAQPQSPRRFTGRSKGASALLGLFTGGAGGLDGGFSTDAIQPDDESLLEQGTDQAAPLGTKTSFIPYKVNHPVLDAIFNQGRGAATASQYNNNAGIQALSNQDATDRINLEDTLATKREQARMDAADALKCKAASDANFNVGANEAILHSDEFDKAHGIDSTPLSMEAMGRMAQYKMGNTLDTLGAGAAENLYNEAVAKKPFISDLISSGANKEIANNQVGIEDAINKKLTFTSGRQFIPQKEQTIFDVGQATGKADVAKANLNADTSDTDLAFNQNNRDAIAKQKLGALETTTINNDRLKKIMQSEKMQTIPVDADHHIMYDPESKDAILVGVQMNPKDPMNPMVTTKHWSMEHNGEILLNGMIKKADGTLFNPKAFGVPSGTKTTPAATAKKVVKKNTYTGGGSDFGQVGDYVNKLIQQGKNSSNTNYHY